MLVGAILGSPGSGLVLARGDRLHVLGIDAPTVTAGMVNVPALGDKFPRGLLVDVPMSVDGGVVTLAGDFLHPVPVTHGSRPDHTLAGVQVNTLEAGTKFELHDHIVSRRYS